MSSPDCQRVQPFLDGRLSDAERSRFEAHWPGCETCRPQVTRWREFAGAFKAGTAPLLAPPTPEQEQAFMRRVRNAEPAPARGFAWRWAFGAAAVAAAAGIAFVALRPAAPVPVYTVDASGARAPVQSDVFEAPAGAAARVDVGEDRVALAPQGRARLVRHDAKGVRFELERGSIAAQVKHRERGETFSVAAGRFEVTVVGTRFRVTLAPAGLRVEVREGHVKVRGPSGENDVLAGQALQLEGEQARTEALAVPDFEELEAPVVVDAGTVAEEEAEPEADVPVVDEPKANPPVPARQLEAWRKAAVKGRCAELLPALRASAREHARQGAVWSVLADCERLAGHDREAAEAYRHVASVAGASEADHARMLLADLLLEKLSDAAGAERVLRRALKDRHGGVLEAATRVKLGRALLAQGKTQLARTELQRVVKTQPDSPPAVQALELLKRLP